MMMYNVQASLANKEYGLILKRSTNIFFFATGKKKNIFCASAIAMLSLAIKISKTSPSKNLRTKIKIPNIKNVLKEGLAVSILI